ncbi:MAG TPA: hypothetical protein VJ954_04800, partial [Ignavibacteriaceae bacterium]|nr:hypothetical protein [Ignavibacteriaceae bacterium]
MKKSNTLFLISIFLTLFYSSMNAQWIQTGLTGGFINKFFVSSDKIYAAAYGGVLVSTDAGLSWSHSNLGFTDGDVQSVVSTSKSVFAGTYFSGIFMKDLNGSIWKQTSLNDRSVYELTTIGDNVFAATYSGVFLSTDNGTTWNQMNNGLTDLQVECFAVMGTNIFAGTGSGVFLSTDMGGSWNTVSTGLSNHEVMTLAVNGTNLYAGTWAGGGIYTSTNNGQGWLLVPNCPTNYVYSIAFNGSKIYAAGQKVCVTTNGGADWAEVSPNNTDGMPWTSILAICYTGGNLIAGDNAVNVSTGIYISNNEGNSWSHSNWGVPNYCTNSIASNNGYILGATSGGVFYSTDEGTEWKGPTMHGEGYRWAEFSAIYSRGNNYVFAGDINGNVCVSTDGGKQLTLQTQIEQGATVTAFASISTSVFAATKPYESGVAGGVYKSSDNGATWTAVNNGLPTLADTNTNVTSLAVIGSNLFAGTGHGVYLSRDNGTNWTKVNNGLTTSRIYSLAVKGNDLFAGTDNGVFLSNNNGTSWKQAGSGLSAKTLIDYPIVPGSSGDNLNRAFYITDYPGTTLSNVTLYFSATTAEAYTIQLQAMNSAYDGTLIGQSTANFSSSSSVYDLKAATFNFNNIPVTKGQVVAFKLSLVSGGSGTVYYCTLGDTGGVSAIVQETEDSTPPLSTPRHGAIAIKVDSGSSINVVSLAAIDTNLFAGTK